MRVTVTGAAGRLGKYIVAELARGGHEVRAVDVDRPAPGAAAMGTATAGVAALQANLTDAGQVYNALAGSDAVIHMGAIADTGLTTEPKTFNDNTAMTFNVLQASADLGIRRVVSASSNQAHGLAGAPPVYVPIDDSHPARPVNEYALSKVLGEGIADFFVEQRGLEVLSFRILNTQTPETIPGAIAAMAADPASGKGVVWTVTDARDVARACRLAVEVPTVESGEAFTPSLSPLCALVLPSHGPPCVGAGVYYIAGPTVALPSIGAAALVAEHYASNTDVRGELGTALTNCERARRVLGWEAEYGWTTETQHPEEPEVAAPAEARL